MKVEPSYMHERYAEMRAAEPEPVEESADDLEVRRMSDGPKAGAKWSKYSVEDGKLVRKSEFCPRCGPEYSSLFTQIASLVVAVVTQKIE